MFSSYCRNLVCCVAEKKRKHLERVEREKKEFAEKKKRQVRAVDEKYKVFALLKNLNTERRGETETQG